MMSTNKYENSHDVSVSGNPETLEIVIRFVQGDGAEAVVHTLRTTGIVSHEMIRPHAVSA